MTTCCQTGHHWRQQSTLQATNQFDGPRLKGYRTHHIAQEDRKLNSHKSLSFHHLKETCITQTVVSFSIQVFPYLNSCQGGDDPLPRTLIIQKGGDDPLLLTLTTQKPQFQDRHVYLSVLRPTVELVNLLNSTYLYPLPSSFHHTSKSVTLTWVTGMMS